MTNGNKPLRLLLDRHGSAAVVRICGSVSMAETEGFREALEKLAIDEVPLIVLDMSEMDFICSLGLGAIIAAHLKCRHHRGQIRLVRPTPAVRDLLETTRLTKLFSLCRSVEEAVGA